MPTDSLVRWMGRRRARRRRVVGGLIGLAGLAITLAWGLWYTMHRHWLAASALELEGFAVRLELSDCAWRHGGISHVTNPRSAWSVSDLSDEALKRVADLRNVETLSLAGCLPLTDDDQGVPVGPGRAACSLAGCLPLTDDDLAILARLSHLKSLDLTMTRPHPSYAPSLLTDALLVHLEGLDMLESLSLVDVNITDTGLERFPSLPRLHILDLSGTRITDRSLIPLVDRLPSLDTLALERTAVTEAGIAALWRHRPGLVIIHESPESRDEPN